MSVVYARLSVSLDESRRNVARRGDLWEWRLLQVGDEGKKTLPGPQKASSRLIDGAVAGNYMSPDPGASAPGGDIDCYKCSPANSDALSRQETGVNPVPTLFAMIRHFSLS